MQIAIEAEEAIERGEHQQFRAEELSGILDKVDLGAETSESVPESDQNGFVKDLQE
jgi:hypothetical protein